LTNLVDKGRDPCHRGALLFIRVNSDTEDPLPRDPHRRCEKRCVSLRGGRGF